MPDFDILENKRILVVDDEPDILETAREELDVCEIITATDFDTAINLIRNNTFDLIILDIMGVNGFALLEACVKRKLPAAMLTAHAMNLKSLNLAIKSGAISFLPKEELNNLPELVAEILTDLDKGKTHWEKLFKRMGLFYKEKLGVVWEELEKPPPYPPWAY